MKIEPLTLDRIGEVIALMTLGAPFVRVRTESDYWLYAQLFSGTCPISLDDDGAVTGCIIAFRSQDEPDDVYIQDVMVHPDRRRQGIAAMLLASVRNVAETLGCRRLYLTSEPENTAAHAAWTSRGFVNVPGDDIHDGVWIIRDFKGPGRDRAVYELRLP